MPLSDTEFEQIMSDPSKRIVGDIAWRVDSGHAPAVKFRADLVSQRDWPLAVHGAWYPANGTLFFVLTHAGVGCVARLCVGFEGHNNPNGERLPTSHLHLWTEEYEDRWAHTIEVDWDQNDPSPIWQAFCRELNVAHVGRMLRIR